MKSRLIITSALALLLAACSPSEKKTAAGQAAAVAESASESAVYTELANPEGLPTVIDFSATWCPPCRALKPVFEQLAEKYKGKIDMRSIDVDEQSELAQKLGISGIPYLLFLDGKGRKVNEITGLVTEEELEKALRPLLK